MPPAPCAASPGSCGIPGTRDSTRTAGAPFRGQRILSRLRVQEAESAATRDGKAGRYALRRRMPVVTAGRSV
jgi:hypothetical protein